MPCIQRRIAPSLFGVALLLWGCATVDPRPDYDRALIQTQAALGQQLVIPPDDQQRTSVLVAERMSGGLTADEAVQVALLNNPRIRAAFLRLGIARADVVQAGLLSNPTFGIAFQLPEGGGLTQVELGLAQNIADLWMIPSRTRAAERDLDRAILETAREAVSIANDAKLAYFNAVGAQRALEISRENVSLVGELQRVAQARFDAGAVGALDVNLARGLVLGADVQAHNAQLAAASALRTLATTLGLSGPAADLSLVDALPEPGAALPDPEQIVAIARQHRLDLRAARDAVRAADARVQVEYARVFQNVEIGLALEREARRAQPGRDLLADTARASIASGALSAPDIESRGQRRLARSEEIEAILGPSLSVTLPIFDQNQAQIARARYALQETEALLEALERGIAQEAREATDRLATAWRVARLYEQEVLPQARKTLALSETTYQAGLAPILNVIEAQRSLLEVRQAYVSVLQNAAAALVDLERTAARPAEELLLAGTPTTRPAAAPALRPATEGVRVEEAIQ